MAQIFTPWRMNRLEIPNRLMRSATNDGLANPDGGPSHECINLIAEAAEGGAGLVVTGHAFVNPAGRANPRQLGAHIDAMVGPLTRLSTAVHLVDGLIALQISHAGGQSKSEWTGRPLAGPSALVHPAYKEEVIALDEDGIYAIIDDFAAAAARAQAAGFDAVQIHAAHGYLISQFLSPLTNQRQDEFGGPLQNRAKLLVYIYRTVRQAVGPLYPVMVKLQSEDGVDGGLTLEEAVQCAKWLAQRGCDAIEVSGGTVMSHDHPTIRVVKGPAEEAYYLDNAAAIKEAVSCPVIAVGGFKSRPVVEAALERVDAVAMSRALIREPGLPRLWQQGGGQASACESCRRCLLLALMKDGLACAKLPRE